MLMLTRNVGQNIVIAGKIRVGVANVTGNQVRLGIEAPKGVVIDREEIHRHRVAESLPAPALADPVDLFIKLNPSKLPEEHLVKGRGSFVDACTRAHYEVFLAGFQEAQRTEAEWRQLLADEAEEQAAWDKQMEQQP